MTGDVQASQAEPVQPAAERRPVQLRLLLVLGAAILLVGLVVLGRWWTHPDVFGDHGDRFRAEPVPLAEGPFHVGTAFPPVEGETIALTFRSASAHFAQNTAGADATIWICSGTTPTGFEVGALEEACASKRPVEEGTRWTYGADGKDEYLLVTITPSRPGTVRLDRVDLDYALGADHLFRRGTDSIRLNARFTAE